MVILLIILIPLIIQFLLFAQIRSKNQNSHLFIIEDFSFFTNFARENQINASKMKLFQRLFLVALTAFLTLSAFAARQRAQVTFTTTEGKIVVELYNETPFHRDNFLWQVKHHTYDGVLFHRVINEFMIQGGDPLSKDAKPGQMLGEGTDTEAEWLMPEICLPSIFHERGSLAAAREGDDVNPQKKSGSQQFYIVTGRVFDDAMLERMEERLWQSSNGKVHLTPAMKEAYRTVGGTPHLDGSYTVFGRVIEGMDIVDRIQKVETDANDRPLQDIRITKAVITQKAKKSKTKKQK